MTTADIRALSPADLEALYTSLIATELPHGAYKGHAWGLGLRTAGPLWLFTNQIWQGKMFAGYKVVNRILGQLWIQGDVKLLATLKEYRCVGLEVEIVYRRFGLRDVLRPVSPELWLGRMQAGTSMAHFTLER